MTPTQTHLETLHIRTVEGRGILDVPGFRAQGVHVGLKKKRRDVCLIVSDRPTAAAGVFTQNAFAAAPVIVSLAHLADGDIRAIVCNAGNANACTGKQGMKDAEEMAVIAARELGLEPHQLLVASTGIIGRPLDMEKVRRGVHECAITMDGALGPEVAEAITTTDTTTKTVQLEIEAAGRVFHM
ncbi:MAG TPA: bifunctional ornithine acetyltransferase/N-acetylglutamate synthase, partial [Candidatus Thermoplasmatota archaeon]|nr:bifunctional ornithine acetyltransferase/N-acetylglutamate synthase [Candidatus Thermoplasmatota archaeon]